MATIADVIAVAPSVAGGSAYAEYGGCGQKTRPSPQQGSGGTGGSTASITWDILYSEAYLALSAFFGSFTTISLFGNSTILLTPIVHPWIPDLVANSYHWQAMGWDAAANQESIIRLTVTFAKPPYPVSGPTAYCHIEHEEAGSSVPTPAAAWTLVSGDSPPFDPDRYVGGMRHTITIYHVPDTYQKANLNTYANHVNNPVWQGFPVECLLYRGARSRKDMLQISGQASIVTVSMESRWPDMHWNHASELDGTTSLLTRRSDGARRYPLVNFDDLFKF